MFRKTRHLMFILALMAIMVLAAWHGPAGAVDPAPQERPLRVAIGADNPPFSVKGPDGQFYELLVDFWTMWAETANVRIEFIPGTLEQGILQVKNGAVDIHSGLFENRERAVQGDCMTYKTVLSDNDLHKMDKMDPNALLRLAALAQEKIVCRGLCTSAAGGPNYSGVGIRQVPRFSLSMQNAHVKAKAARTFSRTTSGRCAKMNGPI